MKTKMKMNNKVYITVITGLVLQFLLTACSEEPAPVESEIIKITEQAAPTSSKLLKKLNKLHLASIQIENQVSIIDSVLRSLRATSVTNKTLAKSPFLPRKGAGKSFAKSPDKLSGNAESKTETKAKGNELQIKRQSLVKDYSSLLNSRDNLINTAIAGLDKPGGFLQSEVSFAIFLEELHANSGARNARGFAATGVDCPDIARDGLMHDLFNAIAVDDRAAYVQTIGYFARAYECYPTTVALGYNQDIVAAYEAAIVRTPAIFRDAGKRALLSAISNLLVVSLDAVKAFGPSALQEFILTHRRELGEVLAQPTSPVRLVGLWLYSPEAEQMVQIAQLCEGLNPANTNATTACISGGAVLDAITNPWKIGTGACPLLTMLTPVFDPQIGYICQRGICEQPGAEIPGLQEMLVSGETAYGTPIDTLQAQGCPDGQSILGGGSVGLGAGHADEIVACVSEQASQQRGNVQCFADVASSLRGTRGFDISAPASRHDQCGDPLSQGGGEGSNDITKLLDALKKWKEAHDAVEEWLEDPLHRETFIANIENEFDIEVDEEDLQRALEDTAEVIATTTEDEMFVSEEEVEAREEATGKVIVAGTVAPPYRKGVIVNLLIDRTPEDGYDVTDVADAVAESIICALTNTCDERAEARLGMNEEDETEPPASEEEKKYCRPELGDCGDCSPGAGTRKMLMACMAGGEESTPLDILPGGGFTDPVPWENDDSWAGCFAREPDGIGTSLACVALDCGMDQTPALENGQCVCRAPSGSPRVTNQCAYIDCGPDSFPVIGPGGCMCQVQGQNVLIPATGTPGAGTLFNQR